LFENKKILWAVCQSDQILRQSFNPLRSWLAGYFGFSHGQSVEDRKQLFDGRLDDLVASLPTSILALELDRTRSILGALMDLHWENSLYEQLDAEGRYNNTFLALITLLQAESLRQPVVIFLEDLQFTDTDSRKFLPSLQRTILATGDSYPIAIIATTRPSEVTLDDELITVRIDLRGLAQSAVASFAETMLGGAADPGLVSLLHGRSEGNPYFIEQIIRYLQEENYLETSRTGWALVRRVRSNFLPGDIRALLVARLDQLVHEVKESVQTASVLGREFETRVLSEMLQEHTNIPTYLAEAEKAAIWAPLNEIRYIFSHGLLRDAAYEMQMRARRRELHALAVQALESLYPDDLAPRWVELAYHAEYGELPEKAQNYFSLAGKSASDLYQNQQAIDYYTRALTHTPAHKLNTQFSLLIEREALYNRIGDRTSQRKDLETLEALAGQLDDPRLVGKVDMLFAHYLILVGDYPGVLERSVHVMEMSRVVTDAEVLLDTYRVWPLALLRQGKFDEAMKVALEGRRLARWYADPIKEGYILNTMALIAIEQKNPAIAYGYLERALVIARSTGDRRLESATLGNLGNSAGYIRKDYESAREYYEADYAISHERGDRSAEAAGLCNLGWAAGMQGDFPSARAYHERALQLAREVGHIYLETYTLINLSANTGFTNEAQASLGYAEKALELSCRAGDRSGEAWSLLYRGYAFLLLPDLSRAQEAFEGAMLIRDELGQPGMKLEALAGLIQVFLGKDDVDSALKQTEKILAYLDAGGSLEGAEAPLRVYYACYITLAKKGDPRSQTVLHSAVQLLESQVSKLRSEDSRRQYVENVPWRQAIQRAWHEASNPVKDNDLPADHRH
jgi:tetratricopeptide (TPR) repeat protein